MGVTRRIREGLAAATCTLIGIAPAHADPVDVDAAVMFYSEIDRVSLVEGVVNLSSALDDRRTLSGRLVFDALTGASANGAIPSSRPQTFTSPSGESSYRVQPGDTPLDGSFHDTRLAFAGSLEQQLARLTRITGGAEFSVERDYLSAGVNALLAQDLNERNTTLSAGVSFAHDTIRPEGRIPLPFAPMVHAGVPQPRFGTSTGKDLVDLLAGVTQVLSPAMLFQVNYSRVQVSGYQTDPYKIISVTSATPGPDLGEPISNLYEKRPEKRTKQSVYSKLKRSLGQNVVDLSYRHLWDDWGIRSHTVNLEVHTPFGHDRFLEPSARFYHQKEADFYSRFLAAGAPLPDFASADYRLGTFDAITIALEYGGRLARERTFNVRLGYYLQMGDSSPPEAIGVQREFDLFPNVGALFGEITYGFGK